MEYSFQSLHSSLWRVSVAVSAVQRMSGTELALERCKRVVVCGEVPSEVITSDVETA
jgi:hypothetical protein